MEKNIYTKLLDFQKLNISVLKSSKNPHFKSTYANLNEVLDKVKKPLNDMGIIIIFEPQSEGLKTTLHDTESKTEISGYMKYVDCGNAQKLLACNTYYRRGTLVSLLGLEDEDDDGNKASKPEPIQEPKDPIQATDFIDWQTALDNCTTLAELEKLAAQSSKARQNPSINALFTKRKVQLSAK